MVMDRFAERLIDDNRANVAAKPDHGKSGADSVKNFLEAFEAVGKELAGSIDESTVVLSILAGTPLRTLSSNLNVRRTVRSMPNTPAAVKEGITVWMGTPELSESDRRLVAKVLGAFGEEVMVDDEKYLDMATAISGSGPAYVQPHGRK